MNKTRPASLVTRPVGLMTGGALLTRGTLGLLRRRPPGGTLRWERVNHQGARVTLLAGPALAAAATLTSALGSSRGHRIAVLVAGAGSGAAGVYDDIAGNRPDQRGDKGFAGHLAALRQRRVSAGLVKVAGVGLSGWLAGRSVTGHRVDRLVAGGVVAGTANLVNLLDLRPGRALKAALAIAAVLAAARPVSAGLAGTQLAGPVGAAVSLLRPDLHERVMLGDAGANALGALLGLRLAAAGGPRWRAGVLAVLVGLTAASERISFTRVIESTPVLRSFDALGRLPAALAR